VIKLGTGDYDTNEILLEWFVSARSREIPVSRMTQMTESVESIWLQLKTDGLKVKRYIYCIQRLYWNIRCAGSHNVFRDFTGISGELGAICFQRRYWNIK